MLSDPKTELQYERQGPRNMRAWWRSLLRLKMLWLLVFVALIHGSSYFWHIRIGVGHESDEVNPISRDVRVTLTPGTVEFESSWRRTVPHLFSIPKPGWKFGWNGEPWQGYFMTQTDLPAWEVTSEPKVLRLSFGGIFFARFAGVNLQGTRYYFAVRYWLMETLLGAILLMQAYRLWRRGSKTETA